MELDRIVVVALVNRAGQVLLRSRDRLSTVSANRWSLPGGGAAPGEDAQAAGIRLVREQTTLALTGPLRRGWHGRLTDPLAEIHLLAISTEATMADLPFDPIPGAMPRYEGYVLEFVDGPQVLSGRSFTPVSGYVLPGFLSSRLYRELASARGGT
jgi:8-oxo-dGTP pyrophosphatase MutT (NUDIX family)